jgi:hypothetical protein
MSDYEFNNYRKAVRKFMKFGMDIMSHVKTAKRSKYHTLCNTTIAGAQIREIEE